MAGPHQPLGCYKQTCLIKRYMYVGCMYAYMYVCGDLIGCLYILQH